MSPLFKKFEKWLAPCWALLIFVASVMPSDDISVDSNMLFPHVDKVVHFLMYFILQVLLLRHNDNFMSRKKQVVIFILTASYGFLMEVIQGYFLVDRFYDNYDIIANITGALIGNLFFNLLKS